jgi:hypothetical protein
MSKTKRLVLNVAHADQLESKLYEIESASLAMEEVLAADISDESALLVLSALRRVCHQSFEGCVEVMHMAQVSRSTRRSAS